MNAVIAIMDGRMENALDIARQIRVRGRELRVVGAAEIQANVADYRARVYLQRNLEDYERALRVAAENAETSGTGFGEYYLVLAHLGRRDVVLEKLDQFVVRRLRIGTPDDFTSVYLDALFLESAVLVGHRQVAELLLKRFAGSSVVTSGIFYPTCIPRHLGGACALLGRYEEARKYYDEAIKVCTDMRFRPELALSRLQLTELLLEHYPNEKKDAIEHLDFCIKEFRDMKMQPSLERALRHKEILKA
jgi:tetratricopeptide (TPR) repeat protein